MTRCERCDGEIADGRCVRCGFTPPSPPEEDPAIKAERELLALANEKGKFALQLGFVLTPELQFAFERGIDEHWFDLVDLSAIAHAQRVVMRVFRLTEKGWQRRRELGIK